MASRSSDGRRYYFGLIRGTKHRFYDPESPIIAPESEPILETGSLETRSSSGESANPRSLSESGVEAWERRAAMGGSVRAQGQVIELPPGLRLNFEDGPGWDSPAEGRMPQGVQPDDFGKVCLPAVGCGPLPSATGVERSGAFFVTPRKPVCAQTLGIQVGACPLASAVCQD
jgi:hypothetical protein